MLKRLLISCLLFLAAALGPASAHGPAEHGVPKLPAPVEAEALAPAPSNGGSPEAALEQAAEAEGENVMVHPGLPEGWIQAATVMMALIALWALSRRAVPDAPPRSVNLALVPVIGPVVRFLNRSPYPLLAARLLSVGIFLVVVAAGFFGTVHPEHNVATAFVWNVWWPLVIVAVFFVGSAWCAVCPWDTLATWIVRRRWWRRASPHPGLNLKVPRYLQNVWIALLMFMGLTWLELGMGVTGKPALTAALAVVMLVLSIAYLLVFERKAFCRYACPVGRTLGFYARLSPIAVRPVSQATCDGCRTLECYHGSKDIEPCPSRLVVGRFSENTFCLSCGNCSLSCPSQNVSWRLRTMDSEAKKTATPGSDAAWFMLGLLGITSFHGLTMIPQWGEWLVALAQAIGESGHLMVSFVAGMTASFTIPVAVYAAAIALACLPARCWSSYRRLFGGFSFTALPLAFAYHLAHNMDHLLREGGDLVRLALNPFGTGLRPLTSVERHDLMMRVVVPENVTFALQAGFMVLGFWLAVQIARYQARRLLPAEGVGARAALVPLLLFFAAVTAANLWLMAQDMEMRF